jgi:hypothetical protein
MQRLELTCTSLTPDRIIAHFRADGVEDPVFAYMPHVPGLNPFLLSIGDKVRGMVEVRCGRPELVVAESQESAFSRAPCPSR